MRAAGRRRLRSGERTQSPTPACALAELAERTQRPRRRGLGKRTQCRFGRTNPGRWPCRPADSLDSTVPGDFRGETAPNFGRRAPEGVNQADLRAAGAALKMWRPDTD